MLTGPRGGDRRLLRLAAGIETAIPPRIAPDMVPA
jgi:Asp-tRNA(Asn)/Glu-tRNA(Gln) amidotransferase A subunit family amidase